jgi:hypothetical protein
VLALQAEVMVFLLIFSPAPVYLPEAWKAGLVSRINPGQAFFLIK